MVLSLRNLVDTTSIEKIVLAKRVGQFLVGDQADVERRTVENVARVLAQDVSAHVREVLAFELRRCKQLPRDLLDKIIKDIEAVSGPFLEATSVFSNEELAGLVPDLEEGVRTWLARRPDLHEDVTMALAKSGQEPCVITLVRNDRLTLGEQACGLVVSRFGSNRLMMDQMSVRSDLPLSIVNMIIDKVSDHCRKTLVTHYDIEKAMAETVVDASMYEVLWQEVEKATPADIHVFVAELRAQHRLTHEITLQMAKRGNIHFLESALALEAGLPKARVQDILRLTDPPAFVRLMKMANVSQKYAPKFLGLAKGAVTHH
ncbi:DUF2336 domain-containing protein [Kordiimonas aquimaris]|uniref:DUF2336 domain-containing protein n=1 Tax=Kordiimonas aquimaris TaxID=707591 RepID=UPI0021CEA869|nr:DUF2336 domain-containing protein [Kordiimonas aquimaris]